MKTLIIIGHPDLQNSGSQTFLMETADYWTEADILDISQLYETEGFVPSLEQERLLQYDRLIFQFPLYWYQAPAILKLYIDEVFDEGALKNSFKQKMAGKELGIVCVLASKIDEFQAGGKQGRTMSEILSPYEVFARYYNLTYLSPFLVSQFSYMTPMELDQLMMRYAYYLETGDNRSQSGYYDYIYKKLTELNNNQVHFSEIDWAVYRAWLADLDSISDEWQELFEMNREDY